MHSGPGDQLFSRNELRSLEYLDSEITPKRPSSPWYKRELVIYTSLKEKRNSMTTTPKSSARLFRYMASQRHKRDMHCKKEKHNETPLKMPTIYHHDSSNVAICVRGQHRLFILSAIARSRRGQCIDGLLHFVLGGYFQVRMRIHIKGLDGAYTVI